jgi:hypothetical protein
MRTLVWQSTLAPLNRAPLGTKQQPPGSALRVDRDFKIVACGKETSSSPSSAVRRIQEACELKDANLQPTPLRVLEQLRPAVRQDEGDGQRGKRERKAPRRCCMEGSALGGG